LRERRFERTEEAGRFDALEWPELGVLDRDPAGGSNAKEWWEALGEAAKDNDPSIPWLAGTLEEVNRGSRSSNFRSRDIG
jgi:hypothetical protein